MEGRRFYGRGVGLGPEAVVVLIKGRVVNGLPFFCFLNFERSP